MRQPWADGPRTQQCDGLAFSQDTGRGVAGSCKPLIRRVRNAGRKRLRVACCLDGRAHVAKSMSRSLRAVLRPTFRTPSQGYRKETDEAAGPGAETRGDLARQ